MIMSKSKKSYNWFNISDVGSRFVNTYYEIYIMKTENIGHENK